MSIKGKRAKVAQQAKELSDDVLVWQYLREEIEFDVALWYECNNGFMLLPYQGKVWTEDKIWFPSLLNLNRFCMLCNCKIIMESN